MFFFKTLLAALHKNSHFNFSLDLDKPRRGSRALWVAKGFAAY